MREEEISICILNNTVRLDSECWHCKGGTQKANEPFVDDNGMCTQCNGTGF